MKFHFARTLDDGRISTVINPGYNTKAEAEANATRLLSLRGASKIVLIEVIDTIEVIAKVKFTPWRA